MKSDKPAFAAAQLLLGLGLALGHAGAATAADAADPGYSTVSPIEVFARKDINLNKDTGTGSRLGLTVLEIPASIEVLSGDTIRERGDLSISEAISRVTGVTAIGTPGDGGGAVSARGFTGLGSVMQIYDGMRLFVAAGTITFPFDPWTADRIEVLRGPASVMFGEGAIGGAINVVPKQATPDGRAGQYQLGYGTFNTARAAVGVGGPLSPAVSYRLDASYNRSDNWVERGDSDSLAVS
ncbi:MAG TPA: TonB-dependent receptor plug domain-containing protein, partial [Phenylobacterium sp.]|nr:TonB-dependent receptor plug domain-containing protein [Phenylobacterium sp.]